MNTVLLGIDDESGFSFRNCARNASLIKEGFKPPMATKTGTTVAGVVFKDGVILGADSKTTRGNLVDSDRCLKIYHIQDNIYCCGAGTAADMSYTARWAEHNMELLRLNTNRKTVPVVAAVKFIKQYQFRFQGRFENYFVFGGVDNEGPHIYSIHALGATDRVPYATMGSGSLAAMSIFEARWKPDMTQEEAMELVRDGVKAGVYNDLGSGFSVDLCIIKKGFHQIIRGYHVVEGSTGKKLDYSYKRGTTGVSKKFEIEIINEEKIVVEDEEMEVE